MPIWWGCCESGVRKSVFVSDCCCTKLPQRLWLKTTHAFLRFQFRSSEVCNGYTKPKSRVSRARGSKGESVSLLFQLLEAAHILWLRPPFLQNQQWSVEPSHHLCFCSHIFSDPASRLLLSLPVLTLGPPRNLGYSLHLKVSWLVNLIPFATLSPPLPSNNIVKGSRDCDLNVFRGSHYAAHYTARRVITVPGEQSAPGKC